MVEEVASNIGRATLTILVIIIVVGGLVLIFRTQIFPFFRGEKLTAEAERDAANNFDMLVDNIKKCQGFASTDCICDGFSAWPGAFPRNGVLEINHTAGKVNISISYGKRVLKNVIIENVKLGAIYTNKEKVTFGDEKSIDFSYEPPRYIQPDEIGKRWISSRAVISAYLYKSAGEIYFILGKEKDKAEELEKLKKCS